MARITERYDLLGPDTVREEIISAGNIFTVWDLIPVHVRNSDVVLQVTLDGKDLDDEALRSTYVQPESNLTLRAVPAAEAVGLTLVWIGQNVLAPIIIGFALQQIVSAILGPPKKPKTIGPDSPTYDFDAPQMTTENGTPIALVFGERLISGQLLAAKVEADALGRSKLSILIGLGEGGEAGWDAIGGLTTDSDGVAPDQVAGIFINETPITNFGDVRVTTRLGTSDQAPISFFGSGTPVSSTSPNALVAEAVTPEGVADLNKRFTNLTPDFPFTYNAIGQTDRITITFRYDFLFAQRIICTGKAAQDSWVCTYENKLNYVHYLRIEYKERADDWANATVVIRPVSGLSFSQFFFTFEIENPDKKLLDFRIRDETQRLIEVDGTTLYPYVPDGYRNRLDISTVDRPMYRCYVDTVTEDVLAIFSYPTRALLGIEAIASEQLQGSDFNVTAIVRALKPRVYTDTSTYSHVFTKNLAWHVLFILTNEHAGLGGLVGISEPNLQSFIDAADYFDEQVSDGAGGLEARIEANFVIDVVRGAWDWLTEIMRAFQCALLPNSGQFVLIPDKASPVVMQFNPSNSRDLEIGYTSPRGRVNYLELTIYDEKDIFAQFPVVALDETVVAPSKFVKGLEEAFGTTRVSQALRLGNLRIRQNKLMIRFANWVAGLEHIRCEPFDVVEVADDAVLWGEKTGFARGGTATTIQLDSPVTIGANYFIRVYVADGTLQTRQILNSPGTYTTLSVSAVWDSIPVANSLYSIGPQTNITRQFRITSIERTSDHEATLTGLEYNAAAYDDTIVDLEPFIPKPGYRSTDFPPDVTDLDMAEVFVLDATGRYVGTIEINWTPPISPIYAGAKVWIGVIPDLDIGTEIVWEAKPHLVEHGGHLSLPNPYPPGVTLYAAVAASSIFGASKRPQNAPQVSVALVGSTAFPADVTGFTVSRLGDQLHFAWNDPLDPGIDFWEIRVGASWATAIVIATGIVSNAYSTALFFVDVDDDVSDTFLVKAHSYFGQYSVTAASKTVIIEPRLNSKLHLERDESGLSWSGTLVDAAVDGTVVKTDVGELSGSYETPDIDMGFFARVRVLVQTVISQLGTDDPILNDAAFTLDSAIGQARILDGVTGELVVAATIEAKYADTSGNLASASYAPFRFEERALRWAKFKVTLTVPNGDFRGVLEELFIHMEALQIINAVESEAIAGSSDPYSVTYAVPFIDANSVSLNVQLLETNQAVGDEIFVSNRSANGFDVRIKSGGTVVSTARAISYQAIGF